MRRMLILAMVIALSTLTITGAAAQAAGIAPGRAIGALRIGEEIGAVLAVLGPLYTRDELPGDAAFGYYWPLKRVGAIADKVTGKVVALVVSYDDGYQTDKGIRVGAEIEAVRAAYGQEEMIEPHSDDDALVYDNLGIAFAVDKDGALSGRVSLIFVFARGHYYDIFVTESRHHSAPMAGVPPGHRLSVHGPRVTESLIC